MCIIEVRLAKEGFELKEAKKRTSRRKQKEKKRERGWPESTAQLPLIKVGITFDGHRKAATVFAPILFVKSVFGPAVLIDGLGFRCGRLGGLESNMSPRPLERLSSFLPPQCAAR